MNRKYLRRRFTYFSAQLGERPALAISLLLVCASFLSYGLIRFVLHGDGLRLFGWNSNQTSVFMGGLMLLSYSVLTWRLMNANKLIKRLVLEEFTKQNGKNPFESDFAEMDSILQRLNISGHYFSRNIQTVKLAPEPITAIIIVLLAANIIVIIGYDLLYDPLKESQGALFSNAPWVIAVLVFIRLIHHDIWIIECLKSHIRSFSSTNNRFIEYHSKQFFILLTPMESKCFKIKYEGDVRNKEIAQALEISESTVKTHINNINRKWEHYAQKHQIKLPLKYFAA